MSDSLCAECDVWKARVDNAERERDAAKAGEAVFRDSNDAACALAVGRSLALDHERMRADNAEARLATVQSAWTAYVTHVDAGPQRVGADAAKIAQARLEYDRGVTVTHAALRAAFAGEQK